MLSIADPRNDRGRICAAFLYSIAEAGFVATTLPDLLRAAGVDEETFHRHFTDLTECFGAIWQEFDEELSGRIESAYEAGTDWRESMRSALAAALAFIAAEPLGARLYVVEANFVGGGLGPSRQAMTARLGRLIDQAPLRPGLPLRPPMISEAIAGGIWHHISREVLKGNVRQLPEGLAQLMYFTVLPFLGSEAAEEELRPPPPPR